MDSLANSGMPYYDLMFSWLYKSSPFCSCGYKNIQLICLMFIKVLIKIKRNNIDTLSKLLANLCFVIFERNNVVDGFFYSIFTFKLPFFLGFGSGSSVKAVMPL